MWITLCIASNPMLFFTSSVHQGLGIPGLET